MNKNRQEQIDQDVRALANRLAEDPFAGGGILMGPAVVWTDEEIATEERVRQYEKSEVEKALATLNDASAKQVRACLGM
jgi:hypothetical protein